MRINLVGIICLESPNAIRILEKNVDNLNLDKVNSHLLSFNLSIFEIDISASIIAINKLVSLLKYKYV